MTEAELLNLNQQALKVRGHIIRMSGKGGCFVGAALSCTDLIVYLYQAFLKINLENPDDPGRDYLFLSKGHDVPALYGMFIQLGWLEEKRLQQHLQVTDHLYWHPNRRLRGIEFHSGSLGHLPAVAAGVALDCKLQAQSNRIVVITGDGELNEGSVWECLQVAAARQLDNLLIIVDRNKYQANIGTEELIPLEPLTEKFSTFGCGVKNIDGHNFMAMETALGCLPFIPGKPSVIIAHTIRGKGLPSLEKEPVARWFCNFSDAEITGLLQELHGSHQATLTSDSLFVR